MKFCIDCKHCVDESMGNKPDYRCHAPQAEELRNPVNGEWPMCIEMRLRYDAEENLCDKDARWFEPKEER